MVTEAIDCLLKGLKASQLAKGKIRLLQYFSNSSFSKVFFQLREFCQLEQVLIDFPHDCKLGDGAILPQQLIAPGSGLRRLDYVIKGKLYIHESTLVSNFFQTSSLQELTLCIGEQAIDSRLLPYENTNLKELTISGNLLHPLAALIKNTTSLTCLKIKYPLSTSIRILTNIVQSHRTLRILQVGAINKSSTDNYNLLQLIEASDTSQLEKLILHKSDYDELQPHIHEKHKRLLETSSFVFN